MTNEFIIGLGGCGGNAIREFRRTCKLRKEDFEQLSNQGTRFEYLYIDSDNDIISSKRTWSVYGEDISLQPNEQYLMKKNGGPLPSITEISKYPNVSPWIGNVFDSYRARAKGAEQTDEDISAHLQNMDGAGQLRRYGRVLFTLHKDQINTLIRDKILKLTQGRNGDINFRIFCTLGGGTGSGSVIDMVTMIQTICSQLQFVAKIILHVFVAGEAAGTNNAGSFYENEYCALRDLNALTVRTYKPFMAGVATENIRNNYYTSSNTIISRIYVASELAPGNPSYPQQIKQVAAAVFDSIVYATANSNSNALRVFSGQDLEANNGWENNSMGKAVRTYRFAAIGAKSWRVPTAQINELLKLDIEGRVWGVLQNGRSLPRGMTHRDTKKLPSYFFDFQGTRLADQYRIMEQAACTNIDTLAADIKEKERQDKDVLTDFHKEAAEARAKELQRQNNPSPGMQECLNLCEIVSEEIYTKIYEDLDSAMDWKPGADAWGVKNVEACLDHYIQTVGSWPRTFINQLHPWTATLTNDVTPVDVAAKLDDIEAHMAKREAEWEKIGPLTLMMSKCERMIKAQYEDAVLLAQVAMIPTLQILLETLAENVIKHLNALKLKAHELSELIDGKISAIMQRKNEIENGLAENTKSGNGYADKYAYDQENLVKMREVMCSDSLTKKFEDEVRVRIYEQWKIDMESLHKYQPERVDTFNASIQKNLYKISKEMHGSALSQHAGLKSVLLGNILERLKQLAGTDSHMWGNKLGGEIRNFLSHIPISSNCSGNDGLNINGVTSPAAGMMIGLPENPGDATFAQWLKEEIKNQIPTNYQVDQSRFDIYEHKSKDEIRILYVRYWFPVRFAPVVEVLDKKYRESVKVNAAVCYFSNIDDDDTGLTSKTRPALSKQGEPDQENILKAEVAEKLYVMAGEKRVKLLVTMPDGQIMLLRAIDRRGNPEYGDKFSPIERTIPTPAFKADLDKALKMAILPAQEGDTYTNMTKAELEKVLAEYLNKVDTAEVGTEEWDEARQNCAEVEKILRLQ